MTEQEIEALRAEYAELQSKPYDQLSADELASVSHRMGGILAALQDAGVDTYNLAAPHS